MIAEDVTDLSHIKGANIDNTSFPVPCTASLDLNKKAMLIVEDSIDLSDLKG